MRSAECGIRTELEVAREPERTVPASCEKELVRARDAAYRFLAYRPRSRAEVEAKLLDRHFSEITVRDVLSGLERLGYLNDREFARQWAEARVRLRGFGRRRIERELRDKGIGRDIIKETLLDVAGGETELRTAQDIARRKLKTLQSIDRETCRRRLVGFLERKGFSYDVIRTVLTETCELQSAALDDE